MTKQPKISALETRVRHLTKLRELNQRMDEHILDLEQLNASLEADLQEQQRRLSFLRASKLKK